MSSNFTKTLVKRLSNNLRFSTLSQLRSQVKNEQVAGPKKETLIPDQSNLKFRSLSESQQAFLDRIIRVNQAGELGANYIYAGQYFILAQKDPKLRPVLKHMWEQEIYHHNTFNNLQVERRVRPSLITPLWKLGAFSLGMGTALLSKEAAMACTVAVETVIGGHYNDQLRILKNKFDTSVEDFVTSEVRNDLVSNEIEQLANQIKEFRDDELEHLDTAVEHNAEKAVPYWLLTEAIKGICKAAIWSAERI